MTAPVLDHLVYGVPDLDAAVEDAERRFGVRPAAGGRHPQWGTRNALLGLGGDTYLELMAPDPQAPGPPSLFGLARLASPRLLTWAVRVTDLEEAVTAARARGYDPGFIVRGSRRTPRGSLLRWRLCLPGSLSDSGDGIVPFLIEWGDTPHPACGLPPGLHVVSLAAEHPDPGRVTPGLEALGVALRVEPGPNPALTARLETPRGIVAVR